VIAVAGEAVEGCGHLGCLLRAEQARLKRVRFTPSDAGRAMIPAINCQTLAEINYVRRAGNRFAFPTLRGLVVAVINRSARSIFGNAVIWTAARYLFRGGVGGYVADSIHAAFRSGDR
jgi:hypothetical protein